MKVVSLFDGISCCRVALEGRKEKIDYYASEIDKNALKVSHKNYPTIKQLGNVCDISGLTDVHLLVGGSPCVDLSIGKKGRKGLLGTHSKLFWEFVRILEETKPTYFVFENVASMPEKDRWAITERLKVVPIMIDASLVSAQCRKRYFWTNIPNVVLPEDRKIGIHSILTAPSDAVWRGVSIRGRKDASGNWVNQTEFRKDDKTSALTSSCSSKLALIGRLVNRRLDKDGNRHDGDHAVAQTAVFEPRTDGKSGTLTGFTKDNMVLEEGSVRQLTPTECERLMGLPDNYTEGIAKTARYKCIGNAFSVPVMRHILSFMPCHHGVVPSACAFCRF
jgi:site-specific DNA-cytosine methylase